MRGRFMVVTADVIGVCALAAFAALGAVFVLIPYLENRQAAPQAAAALAGAEAREATLAIQNRTLNAAVETLEQELRRRSEEPLADVGVFLAHMSRQCEAQAIELKKVEPMPSVARANYASWSVHVEGHGEFDGFLRLIEQIEEWSPYVHVEDIHIAGPPDRLSTACDLRWTVRVNYLPGGADAPGGAG